MKKNFVVTFTIMLISIIFITACSKTTVSKDTSNNSTNQVQESAYGSQGALKDDNLTYEKMLRYAMEDEFLARSEYEAVIKKYGQVMPFTNIINAEKSHISSLRTLFSKYNYTPPEDTSNEHIVMPQSLNEAYKTGVNAEISNIAMYDKFMKQELPDDIKQVFSSLRDASKNHLNAFQKNVQ